MDILDEIQKLNIQYREIEYNNGKDIIKLKLRRNGLAEIVDYNVIDWTESKRPGKWKWKYNVTQILSLYYEGELKYSFKIIENLQDTLVRQYESSGHSPRKEIYHLKLLKLVRMN